MPMSIYDIPNLEAWLEEQAKAGWFPEWTTGTLSLLRRGTPTDCRYLMEPCSRGDLEPSFELRDLYREHGWEYVERLAGQFFLFRTTRPDASDLHTDPRVQAVALEGITRAIEQYNRRRRFIWSLYGLVLLLLVFVSGLPGKFDAQPARPWANALSIFISYTDPFVLFLIAAILLCHYDWRSTTKRLKRYQEQLTLGFVKREPLEPHYRLRNLLLIFCVAIEIPWLIHFHTYSGFPLDQLTHPYLTLQELEQEEVVRSHVVFGDSHFHDDENRAEIHHALLAPLYYTTTENVLSAADVAEQDYQGYSPVRDDNLCYSPNLDARYYHLLFPQMAHATAKSLLNQMRLVNLFWEYEELSVDGADFVIIAEATDQIYQMVACAKGNRLIIFRYGGEQRLRDHLDLLLSYLS